MHDEDVDDKPFVPPPFPELPEHFDADALGLWLGTIALKACIDRQWPLAHIRRSFDLVVNIGSRKPPKTKN